MFPTRAVFARSKKIRQFINVALNVDVPQLGVRNAIVPVARGRMRNYLYPSALARYLSDPSLTFDPSPPAFDPNAPLSLPSSTSPTPLGLPLPSAAPTLLPLLRSLPPLTLPRRPTVPGQPRSPLYGSVSLSDVEDLLADEHGVRLAVQGARVVGFEDLDAQGAEVEGGRVKALGRYEVKVQLDGQEELVRLRLDVVDGQSQ